MFLLIPICAMAVILGVYVPLRVTGKKRASLIMKTLISVVFIFFALLSLAFYYGNGITLSGSSLFFILFTVAGLVFGLLGDVWLDLKDHHLESRPFYMYCGFSSFMIGHLIFMTGLLLCFAPGLQTMLLAAAIGAVATTVIALLEKPLKLDYGSYRAISLTYAFVLSTTVALPLLMAFTCDGLNLPRLIFGAGMVMFILSDLVLSGIYFGTSGKKPKPAAFFLNYLFYYGAQFTIAGSLYFLS